MSTRSGQAAPAGVSVNGVGGRRGTRAALVMLAAGDGRRTGHDTNKVLLPLAGRRVYTWAIRWARELPGIVRTVLVIREQDRDTIETTLTREVEDLDVTVVTGGTSRHGSEWAALQVLAPDIERGDLDVVVIHDAARPLASTALFSRVITCAAEHGGALPALIQDDLTAVEPTDPLPELEVIAVQTPQAFAAPPLLAAYRRADRDGFVGTDTASCMERYTDSPVHWVDGDARNIKITFPEDLFLAERLLAKAGWDLTGLPHPRTEAQDARHRRHLRDLWRTGERT
ncbi:MAG: 2-C-methyl-D-erythritol 4-phosphate cytidylyltransferase [Nocardioides sp.]|uniref:IspD/TarI family cytidylyltransferase n=1 Tax=Nocardioides sp. TaxID=35761 RepID=UPI0039E53244